MDGGVSCKILLFFPLVRTHCSNCISIQDKLIIIISYDTHKQHSPIRKCINPHKKLNDNLPLVTPSLSLSHLDVLVVGVSEQWIGQARTMSPPAVVDLHHHGAQSGRPLFQKLLPYCLQIAHEEFQDATILHVS